MKLKEPEKNNWYYWYEEEEEDSEEDSGVEDEEDDEELEEEEEWDEEDLDEEEECMEEEWYEQSVGRWQMFEPKVHKGTKKEQRISPSRNTGNTFTLGILATAVIRDKHYVLGTVAGHIKVR